MKWAKRLSALWSALLGAVGLVAVLIALLDFFGLEFLKDRTILELTLLVAGMIAAYLLYEKREILLPMRKDVEGLGTSRVLVGKPAIYGEGTTKIFGEIKPRVVRVYASSGLWREDDYKKRWLEAVKQAVNAGDIEAFQGVFGLPPTHQGFSYFKDVLIELFDTIEGRKQQAKLSNVFLRYLPPHQGDVPPMMGAIIVDKSWLAIGLACVEGDPVVDMTTTHTSEKAVLKAAEWFEKKIWNKCGQEKYILKQESPEIPELEHVLLQDALKQVEQKYYNGA
jgi:hypothetical protein